MGAAGDMLTAALLELIPDREAFVKEFNALGIPGVSMHTDKSVKSLSMEKKRGRSIIMNMSMGICTAMSMKIAMDTVMAMSTIMSITTIMVFMI